MTFALNLKERRAKKKWSQDDLARRCKMNRVMISHFESGARIPSLQSIRRIQYGLGCSFDRLIDKLTLEEIVAQE